MRERVERLENLKIGRLEDWKISKEEKYVTQNYF